MSHAMLDTIHRDISPVLKEKPKTQTQIIKYSQATKELRLNTPSSTMNARRTV